MANAKSDALNKKKRESLEPSRKRLEEKFPHLKGHVGIEAKGLYRHNPKTGFSELIHKRTGEFRKGNKSPY